MLNECALFISDVRPITPPAEIEGKDFDNNNEKDIEKDEKPDFSKREHEQNNRIPERKITVANTDLLFKLFEGVENRERNLREKAPIKRGR